VTQQPWRHNTLLKATAGRSGRKSSRKASESPDDLIEGAIGLQVGAVQLEGARQRISKGFQVRVLGRVAGISHRGAHLHISRASDATYVRC
jgi:hypothetical protein